MTKTREAAGFVHCLRIAGLSAALAIAGTASLRAEEPPIKIGLTTDLTGVAAVYARGQVNGVQLAADEINAAGGIKGRKIEIIVRDSQLKPELGASLTRDLITREHVDYLIGPDSSAVGVAVTNVAKQYKKVVMMTIPNTPRLTGELFHPYFFTIVETGSMLAKAMADGPGKQYNHIAFIGGDYEASHQAVKYFTDFLAKSNPKAQVIQAQYPKLGETDFAPYITQLIAAKPDLVYSYLWGSDMIAFVKQAKSYGLFDKTKVATLLFLDDLRALGPDMPDGLIGQMYAPPFGTDTERMHQFIQRYQAKYHEYPSDYPVLGYDGMSVLAAGITAATSFASDDVVAALEHINFPGLEGSIEFRAVDHQSTGFSFLGVTGTAPGWHEPFKTMVDIERIPAQAVWPTPEEILAERKPK